MTALDGSPEVRVAFTAEPDPVIRAVREMVTSLRQLQGESGRTARAAEQTSRSTASFAERLRVGTQSADPFSRGLKALYDQELRAGQGAEAAARKVDAMAAAMSRAAAHSTDVLKLNSGFALAAQQRAKFDAATGAGVKGLAAEAAGITSVVGGLQALAGGYVGLKVIGFAHDTIEAAAALHELSQQTGASVERLSVLQFAGARAGVETADLAAGFKGLALSMGALRGGGKEAVAAFQTLGLSAKDLAGLSVDQVFERITLALGKLPPGLDRTEAAVRIFGRSGAALIPLLDDLAHQGFPAVTDAARQAGAVITDKAAAAADKFSDQLKDLEGAAGGAARSILNPLLPAMTQLAEAMTELFARRPGDTFRRDFDDLGHLVDVWVEHWTGQSTRLREHFNATFGDSLARPAPSFADVLGSEVRFRRPEETRDEAFDPTAFRTSAEEIKALGEILRAGRLDEAQKRRIAEIVAHLNAEYKQATGNLTEQARILAQIQALTGKSDREHQSALDKAVETLGKIEDSEQLAFLQPRIQAVLAQLRQKYAEAAGDLAKQAAIWQQIQTLSAKVADETKRQADEQQRAATAAYQAYVAGVAKAGLAQLEKAKTTRGSDGLTNEERQLGLGPVVQQAKPLTFTEKIDRQQQEDRAKSLAYLQQLKAEGSQTIDVMQNLGEALRNNVASVLDQLFIDGKAGFADFARAAVQSIQRIIDQFLAAKIAGAALSLFTGGIPGAPSVGGLPGGALSGLGLAAGGPVRGPGTATSDSIPAWLSHGEYVQPARAVHHYGPAFMEALRTLQISKRDLPGYATGGPVRRPGTGASDSLSVRPERAIHFYGRDFLEALRGLRISKEALAGSTRAAAAGSATGPSRAYASGGMVRGPGTGTSDSVLMWGSHGEFVQPERAVSHYGRDFMEALRRLQIPKTALPGYAAGGLVGAAPRISTASVSSSASSHLVESLRVLESHRLVESHHLQPIDLRPLQIVSLELPRFAAGGLVEGAAHAKERALGHATINLSVPEGVDARVSDSDGMRFVVRNRRAIAKALGV